MAQFTTTTQIIRDRTVTEGFTPDLSDIILADHGPGSKRHRAFTIQEIADLILGGETDEIVIKTTGGSQEVTLTLTPSAITFTKVDGQTTTTRKIDFNGEDTNLDSMRVKKLSGSTPTGASSYKLVIDTVTEILENVVIGTSESNKNLTIHGNLKIDGGKVDSDVVIGGTGQDDGHDLTVNGSCIANTFNAAGLITIDDDTSLIGNHALKDILYVYNSTSSTKKVYCMPSMYVELNGWCSMGFIRVNNNDYSPMENVTFHNAGT